MWQFLAKVLVQLKRATIYSIAGLKSAFQEEFAFRLEVFASCIALPLAFVIGHCAWERIALISSFLLVPIVELLNSAIEITLNRINLEWHALTKKAKDIGSAAVMLAIVNALIVWLIILLSHS